jgi:hypothetical protein
MTDDFIGVYKNAFSKEYCQNVINYFNNCNEAGLTVSRQKLDEVPKIEKEDLAIFATREEQISLTATKILLAEFAKVFWDCYADYASKFSVLNTAASHQIYNYKVQKTEIGQGYHIWHAEAMDRVTSNRLLVWTVYLNDVEEGGETEFLYQHKRVKPEQGTLLIWPASFTHTHRGNPPISNTKYIVTGWVEF